MANKQILFCGTNEEFLSPECIKDADDGNRGVAFRIPSLVNAGGTLVAAIDNAYVPTDWGYIEIGIRTSNDGGKTWTPLKSIATPPARVINSDKENTATAFYIDPCMTVAPNGDIVMLVTYYPESKGLFNKKMMDKGKLAYASFDGHTVPLIYDRDGSFYYVLNNGKVLDKNKKSTPYTVNFTDGELYKDSEYVGNIFLNGAKGKAVDGNAKTTYGAPLKAVKRNYVFMLKSSDKGETWSKPVDITGSILNQKKDGFFLGVAPGSALTTKNGRMLFPLYTLNGTVCVYSDDNGETWRRNENITFTPNIDEWTLAEGPEGVLYSFSRAKGYKKTPAAISRDNGITWEKTRKAPFKAPKCQKNCLVIGDRMFVSHPSKKGRHDGVISVGTFDYDKKGKCKGIKWSKDDIKINEGFYAYSCMTRINDNTIGVLYEDQPSSHIAFETFNV